VKRQQRLAEGKKKPRILSPAEKKILASQPPLGEAESIVLRCWNDLDSARAIGPAWTGSIPWPAIREWVHEQGGDQDVLRVVAWAIQYLDVERAERLNSERQSRKQQERKHR
jgi:hypothetical protein